MPKERSINPAQAQRKADKAKAIKKGKAEQATRRNEKLAQRNPNRLQKQIDDLKAIETSGGKLTSHETTLIEGLERDLKAVRKAREALGDAPPRAAAGAGGLRGDGRPGGGGAGGGTSMLGKRRRHDDEDNGSDDDVPDDVRRIPMPRDTPPPIPKEILDGWYQARRDRAAAANGRDARTAGTNANKIPLGQNDRRAAHLDGLPSRPLSATTAAGEKDGAAQLPPLRPPPSAIQSKTVYEATPKLRDLRKEAAVLVPAAVRAKLDKGKGRASVLVEPEEADELEREGYMPSSSSYRQPGGADSADAVASAGSRRVEMEDVKDEDG